MKASVFIGTSLDGFIARENGDIDWLEQYADREVYDAYREFVGTIDAMVIGRGTFEKVLTFAKWPYEKPVFLLSRSIKQLPAALKDKAEILSMSPGELLGYLAGKGFINIYVDGGKVIQGFLLADLIDEMVISRAPILLGSGIPLFGSLNAELRFRHLQTTAYSNGIVRSKYERIRTEG